MMRKSLNRSSTRRGQRGFSLIELLISLVIGLVVVGAVFAAYLSTGSSGRSGRALSQVTEDASIALNVLRSGINMVGYGAPVDYDSVNQRLTKLYMGPGIFGCDDEFTNIEKSIDQLGCGAAGVAADSIAVAYEADRWNSVTTPGNVPLNCLGDSLALSGGYYLNYSRFYVDGNQLMCRGAGAGDPAPQALVDNVVDMQIQYGVAKRVAGDATTYGAAYYDSANVLGGAPNGVDWANVVSVRICVVVRSSENALTEAVDYEGCDGQVEVDSSDLRLYRAFTTTVVLQNRLGAVL
jgi:type IV pilus assembly protein PilW